MTAKNDMIMSETVGKTNQRNKGLAKKLIHSFRLERSIWVYFLFKNTSESCSRFYIIMAQNKSIPKYSRFFCIVRRLYTLNGLKVKGFVVGVIFIYEFIIFLLKHSNRKQTRFYENILGHFLKESNYVQT